ncbi:hypothetical protein S7711_10007 [Stachybotrys chartarum IBT 7711]|uniref:Heterokaryon incompatibility domain-containing protein n=1 Tax=Stachybotrys chartarum (strain CBS 109288 / IBT 7711) TaxID=1280523 RepID=A0A084ALT5_STACB|nr:hypothetical protein S7711_10007 [Stachybotrys chartarum IBT 7711]KFA46985.1 hypothetical protein S40293_10049 [Stachybotrys chartarum IBT 40293]
MINGDIFGTAILFLQLYIHHSLGAVHHTITSTARVNNEPAHRTINKVLHDFIPLDRFVAPCLAIRRQYQLDRSIRFFNLAFLLHKYRHLSFGDHKDRVWGLLGLANDAEKLRETVNVRLTWQETFIQAARHYVFTPIRQDDWLRGMNVLALASYKTPAPPSTRANARRILPSWVPDYRLAEAAWGVPILDSEFLSNPTRCRRATSLSQACHRAYLSESLDGHDVTAHQVMNFEEQLYPLGSRSSFLREQGFVGMGSPWIREGDVLVVLEGAMVPSILQQVEETEHFTLVSKAFCDGLMDGEVADAGHAEVLSIV